MKITILASGSGGNSAVFEAGGASVMVDAGIGFRAATEQLAAAGMRTPDAIVITHAHGDHVGHCGRLARRWNAPVYMTEATARVARHYGGDRVRVYGAREPFAVRGMTIAPTPLPHDAAQVALVLSDGVRSAAIATDLGEVPPALPAQLAACDVLLIESNHDPEMLARGPYPQHLKRRIASARGHLSNEQTHELLRALPPRAHTVVLMHLSKTNNTPAVALELARDALAGRRARLLAASQEGALVVDATADAPEQVVARPANAARGARRRPEQLRMPW